jgi:SseB protein C-terminal domain
MRKIVIFVFAMSIVLSVMASPVDELHVPSVQFVAEKTGRVETDLEQKLSQTLRKYTQVESAYLVIVAYPNTNAPSVALCIRAESGNERAIAKAMGEDFSSMFNATQALDIMFVSSEQEEKIKRVAKPFYVRS